MLEQFPTVTILFCSFDKKCVQDFLKANSAEEFFATVASIILEFDLFLEMTDLFKVLIFMLKCASQGDHASKQYLGKNVGYCCVAMVAWVSMQAHEQQDNFVFTLSALYWEIDSLI